MKLAPPPLLAGHPPDPRTGTGKGSFGNQKQHYGVSRIATRNKDSETLQLFFAIHMANAAILAERRRREEEKLREKRNTA